MAQLERREWWRENRSEVDLFDEELAAAVASLAERNTQLPIVAMHGERQVRRLLMPKTRCHLYFEIRGDLVIVVSAWGARMGSLRPLSK